MLVFWPMRACSFMSDSFVISWTVALQLLCPWNYPSKNIREDCHFLLQEVFQTQGSNPHLLCLLHCRWMLYLWDATFPLNYFALESNFSRAYLCKSILGIITLFCWYTCLSLCQHHTLDCCSSMIRLILPTLVFFAKLFLAIILPKYSHVNFLIVWSTFTKYMTGDCYNLDLGIELWVSLYIL